MSKISFAVIAYNTEQQRGLVLRYPSKNRILPQGVMYPSFGDHCFNQFVPFLWSKLLSHEMEGNLMSRPANLTVFRYTCKEKAAVITIGFVCGVISVPPNKILH